MVFKIKRKKKKKRRIKSWKLWYREDLPLPAGLEEQPLLQRVLPAGWAGAGSGADVGQGPQGFLEQRHGEKALAGAGVCLSIAPPPLREGPILLPLIPRAEQGGHRVMPRSQLPSLRMAKGTPQGDGTLLETPPPQTELEGA